MSNQVEVDVSQVNLTLTSILNKGAWATYYVQGFVNGYAYGATENKSTPPPTPFRWRDAKSDPPKSPEANEPVTDFLIKRESAKMIRTGYFYRGQWSVIGCNDGEAEKVDDVTHYCDLPPRDKEQGT